MLRAKGKNGTATRLADVEPLAAHAFREACLAASASGERLGALLETPCAAGRELLAVFVDDADGTWAPLRVRLDRPSYPALSNALPEAQAFEREVFETGGIVPEGHPWLKPLRRHPELEREGRPDAFLHVEGAGVHEVGVGPVHAGVIEPGHFRFACHGETVLSLEIHLGYQRRGLEALVLAASPARRLVLAESIAGDTVIGHAAAHCAALEALAGVEPPLGAQVLRGIALELERLANHVGDLGAFCNDVAFLPGAAYFGRLRGEFLNLLMELSGNRFGRGLLVPGGVRFDLEERRRHEWITRLRAAERDLRATAEATFGSSSVLSRFEQTGVVTLEVAEDFGLVGPVARASGCDRDVRRDHPAGIYRFAHIPAALVEGGDVMARALVRWIEVQRSLTFVREQLLEMRSGRIARDLPPLRPGMLSVALVEGWRGQIAHVAATDDAGGLGTYKVVDPSFQNWTGLALALRGAQISDFPLCNKSFNLSYAGHDL